MTPAAHSRKLPLAMPRTPAARPNVVVFFTDQQRWDSVGAHGNPLGLTPNFDRIARGHTHVQHSFTCQPVCGPARACLQTGQYATTTGVWGNGFGLRRDADTLAKRFGAAGYQTQYIGKWHLSHTPREDGPVREEDRGGYEGWLAAQTLEFVSDEYHTRLWDADSRSSDWPGYRVDALTDRSIAFLHHQAREHPGRPFFLFTSYLEPHHQNHVDDYPPPDGYREMYAGRWTPPDLAALGGSAAQHLGGYCGMVKRLDEAFGRLMDALKSLDLDRNTIVLFTSDHGCHFKTRNAEYKRTCHESSIRVPTLLAGPGFEGGGQLPQLVSLVDLPPTLLDAPGLDVPPTMQGRSIMPLVRREPGAAERWPEEVFVQSSESQTGRAVRTHRWKYSVSAPNGAARDGRADRYAEEFLYDLQYDPHELRNLIQSAAHAPVREAMRERLLRRIREVEGHEPVIDLAAVDPGFNRNAVFPNQARM